LQQLINLYFILHGVIDYHTNPTWATVECKSKTREQNSYDRSLDIRTQSR